MREDGQAFAHEHAEVTDERGRPVFAIPGKAFGPELGLHAEFDTPRTHHVVTTWTSLPPAPVRGTMFA